MPYRKRLGQQPFRYTRIVGSIFYESGCYSIYNARDSVMMLSGEGESKTKRHLESIAKKDNIKIVISQTETEKLCNIYASDVLGLVQNDPRYATIINDTGDLKNMPQKHLEHHLLTASATVDGNKVNMLEDDGSINASVPLKVVNTRGFDLPQTGDHGTWMFSVIGILLMAGAAVVIIMTSRKKRTADQ